MSSAEVNVWLSKNPNRSLHPPTTGIEFPKGLVGVNMYVSETAGVIVIEEEIPPLVKKDWCLIE